MPFDYREKETVAARSQEEVKDNGRDTAACKAQQNRKGKQEELNGSNLVSSVEAVRMRSSRSRHNWILAFAGPRREPYATPAAIPVAPESWAT